jgi:hypothetical protein
MARTQLKETSKVKEMDPKFLVSVFTKDFEKKSLKKEELSKVDLFEKGLAGELSTGDTIDQSVEKIVKMALAAEFGAGLLTKTGAKAMVSTISRGILGNSELRKSALLIADRFADKRTATEIKLRNKSGKKIMNG